MPRLFRFLGLLGCLLSFAACGTAPDPVVATAAASTLTPSGSTESSERGLALTPKPVLAPQRPARPVPGANPRDAYVLLSGGGTPLSNNYSQYLQARAIAGYFGRTFPAEATWIFFGAGNREGAPPTLADARRDVRRDGIVLDSWEPGLLPRNRPATRDNILRALREEILPRVKGGGTLYLFVGDHGELAGKGDQQESAITLWQLRRGRRGNWSEDDKEILGVADLRRVLEAGLGAGRVVFCMTQCHSGGFHELGLAREMTPPRAWFTTVPGWVPAGKAANVRLRVAGFTATDQASIAAGCDRDPDPERWAGYERFLPENLLGLDLMSGQPKARATASFAEAHEAAILVDRTIDKPRSTSEHYLAAWARLIETKLAGTLAVTPKTQQAVAAYQRAVDTGRLASGATDPALRERQAQFARFAQRMGEQLPEAAKNLPVASTRVQLENAMRGRGERGAGAGGGGGGGAGGGGGRRGRMAELRRNWTETLRPAWKAAVLAGRVEGLSGAALEFEKKLLKLEDDGRDLLLPRGGDNTALSNEIFWSAGYGDLARFDAARAEAVARWGATRRTQITAWGRRSSDAPVRAAAEKIGPAPVVEDDPPEPLSRQIAAERVLFHRRVLAAWEFLLAMDAQSALTELRELIALERTPLARTKAE